MSELIDGLPYSILGITVETDAPVPDGSRVYGADSTYIVGIDPDGNEFHWVLQDGVWENLSTNKSVVDWTNDDWSNWDNAAPVYSAPVVVPDTFSQGLMALGAHDFLVVA